MEEYTSIDTYLTVAPAHPLASRRIVIISEIAQDPLIAFIKKKWNGE